MRKRKNIIVYLLLVVSVFLITSCTPKEKSTEITIADLTMSVPGEWTIDADKSDLGAHEVYSNGEHSIGIYVTLPDTDGTTEAKARANSWNDNTKVKEFEDLKDYSYYYYDYVRGDLYNIFIGVADGQYYYSIAGTIQAEDEQEVIDFLESIMKSIK